MTRICWLKKLKFQWNWKFENLLIYLIYIFYQAHIIVCSNILHKYNLFCSKHNLSLLWKMKILICDSWNTILFFYHNTMVIFVKLNLFCRLQMKIKFLSFYAPHVLRHNKMHEILQHKITISDSIASNTMN